MNRDRNSERTFPRGMTKRNKKKKRPQIRRPQQPTFVPKQLGRIGKELNFDAILSRIPSLNFEELRVLWLNAIRLLDEASSIDVCKSAQTALDKISAEWSRRSAAPVKVTEYFKWPSTAAPGGDGRLTFGSSLDEGLLSYMEYRVGRIRGLHASARRVLLSEVYKCKLPPVFPSAYLDGWGKPETAQRLRKLAETLAAFVRNAKRRRGEDLDDAIGNWEADLHFLYEKFYVAKFGFAWPSSVV